jgi:hypothetical protein
MCEQQLASQDRKLGHWTLLKTQRNESSNRIWYRVWELMMDERERNGTKGGSLRRLFPF